MNAVDPTNAHAPARSPSVASDASGGRILIDGDDVTNLSAAERNVSMVF